MDAERRQPKPPGALPELSGAGATDLFRIAAQERVGAAGGAPSREVSGGKKGLQRGAAVVYDTVRNVGAGGSPVV